MSVNFSFQIRPGILAMSLMLLWVALPSQVTAQSDTSEGGGDPVPPPEVIRREGITTIRVYLSSEEGMFGEAEDVLLAVDSFDLEGRRVRHESPVLNRSVTTWRWTAEGEPEEVVKRRRGARVGDTTVTRTLYAYGPIGLGTGPRRLLRETRMVHSGTRGDTMVYEYRYNEEGRLFWKENVGEPGEGFDEMYSWQDSLLIEERTVASGTRAIREFGSTTYTYDSLGHRTGMIRKLGRDPFMRSIFEYDRNGRRTVEHRYNSEDSLFLELLTTWDEAGRIAQQITRDGTGTTITTATYHYNEAGLPTTLITTGTLGTTHTRFDYTYR